MRRPTSSIAGFARTGWLLSLAIVASAAVPLLAPAEPSSARPPASRKKAVSPVSYDDAGCAKCHAALTGKKEVHAILAGGGGCAECHHPVEGDGKCLAAVSKAWKLAAPDPKLCAKCHDMRGEAPPHPVIEAMGCSACHDPHSSDHPKHLKDESPALCSGCHDGKDKKKVVHAAVADCLNCHDPHAGAAAPLLKKSRERLCFECHDPKSLFSKRVHHAPVEEGRCLECHDPHSSDLPVHLVASGKALCLKCHEAKARPGADCAAGVKCVDLKKKNVHPAVDAGDCQDCHAPGHSAANAKLLEKRPPELCYGCHDRKDGQPFTHGAVKLGDCGVCHDPHSTGEPKLLRQDVAKGLCFRCHTDDVTGRAFVHAPVATGDCTMCHDPHGSPNPFNLSAGEGKKVCYSCHQAKDADVKVKHRAIERYGCTACHDPHGSGNSFQLAKPVNTLCQSCHADKKDGMHVTTFVAGGHKIAGGADPHDLQKDFSCISCHEPHGTNSPKLLRFGADAMEFCDWCHGDRTGKHPELKDITQRKRPKPEAATGAEGGASPGKAPAADGAVSAPASAPAPATPAPLKP